MDFFDVIKDIEGPFALIAFISALLALIVINFYKRETRLIKAVKNDDQADLVSVFYKMYSSKETKGLTRDQKYNLIVKSIESRLHRIKLLGIILLSLIFLIGIIFLIERTVGSDKEIIQKRHDRMPVITGTLEDYILRLQDFHIGLNFTSNNLNSTDLICDRGARSTLGNTIRNYNASWEKFNNSKSEFMSDAEVLWDDQTSFQMQGTIKDIEDLHRRFILPTNSLLSRINDLKKKCDDDSETSEKERVQFLADLTTATDNMQLEINDMRTKVYSLITTLQNSVKS